MKKEITPIVQWAQNEVRIAKNMTAGTDENKYFTAALNAFKTIQRIEGSDKFDLEFISMVFSKLCTGQVLTPIDKDGYEWCPLRELYGTKLDIFAFYCERYPALVALNAVDEHDQPDLYYTDTTRVICVDIMTGENFNHPLVTNIVDNLFPITLPYTPAKYYVFVENFSIFDNPVDFNTLGVLYILLPTMDKVDIYKFFNINSLEEVEEITKDDYSVRKAMYTVNKAREAKGAK